MDKAETRALHEGREGTLGAEQAHTRSLRIGQDCQGQVLEGEALLALEVSEECFCEKEELGLGEEIVREEGDCEEDDGKEIDRKEIGIEDFADGESQLVFRDE